MRKKQNEKVSRVREEQEEIYEKYEKAMG